MKDTKLQLKAKHFLNTDFANPRQCAIGKALKENNIYYSSLGHMYVELNGVSNTITHNEGMGYYVNHFDADQKQAEGQDPEAVIREITFTAGI